MQRVAFHTMIQRTRNGRSRRYGQAILEMAFVIGGLLMLTMGLIQYSLIYNASLSLTHLTREGTRYAAVHGRELASMTAGQRNQKVMKFLEPKISAANLRPDNAGDLAVNVNAASFSSGAPVTMELTYNMNNKFFLPVATFPGLSHTKWNEYKTTATMVIE